MDLYASKQEVTIIRLVSAIWTTWELYRDWDKTATRMTGIYKWFTKSEKPAEAPPVPENRAR